MTALGTRDLVVSVGGTDYTSQVSDCRIAGAKAESGTQTFTEAKAGGARKYTIKFKLTQDLATGTLWDKIWSAAGTTVAVLVKPYGNTVASPSQPHYSGNVVISEPDGDLIGGEADSDTQSRWWVEVEWDWTAKPTKVTA